MRVARIIEKTEAEGIGTRFAIWMQGCSHNCRGCYASDMHSSRGGEEISISKIFGMIRNVSDSIEGVTFLGGEPLEQAQELASLVKMVKKTGLSVTVFTGYVYEYIEGFGTDDQKEVLKYTDLLIDGPYIEEKRDFSRPLVGSSNQRFIFLTDRYSQSDIDGIRNRIEVRVTKNGVARINGMGDFPLILEILTGRTMIDTHMNKEGRYETSKDKDLSKRADTGRNRRDKRKGMPELCGHT